MPNALRFGALAAFLGLLTTADATAQVAPVALPAELPEQLLLPPTPAIGHLRFDADQGCSPSGPVPLDAYADLSPLHQRMLRTAAGDGRQSVHACWQNLPTPAAAALFNAAMHGPAGFQFVNRWTSTATSGGGLGQGDPTVLTFSFVPDGTFIPNGIGEGPGTSNLFSTFNSVFLNQNTWQDRVRAAFDRWGELTGITYVFEPNDDGAAMINSGGVVGVRGDIRIGGKLIDGTASVLAYNYFPSQGGEMVFDTGDLSYFSSPFNNYRALFNVTGHEHGHGLGIDHVCPTDQTKLMEPLVSLAFNGPQFDDILTGQRLYGDPLEPNDNLGSATDLGTLANGTSNVATVSSDDNSDIDYYRFDIVGDKQLSVDLVPTGAAYLEGPEIGNCMGGTLIDPSSWRNLGFLVLDASGATILANANSQPTGSTESISSLVLTTGTYHLRIAGDGVNTIQTYRLDIELVDDGDTAAAVPFGNGCGGITWSALNRPLLGSTQILRLQNIPNPTSSIGLVLLGVADIPGGLDLGFLGAPGCTLYVDTLDIRTVFPLVLTNFTWLLPIPNTLALSGSSVFTQGALLVPPGTNPLGAITANAVELTLGTL